MARHADNALLASIHNPSILNRTQAIAEDITYLLKLPNGADWQTHPVARRYRASPPTALQEYVERIHSLEAENRQVPSHGVDYVYPPPPAEAYLLLSHAYVRYMGDLNGGQIIKDSVSKAYHLERDSDDGLRFYRFDNEQGVAASPAELSKLTAWYRKGIDSVGDQLQPEQRGELHVC